MDATLVDAEYISSKIDILKCQSTLETENWFRDEFFGISCCKNTLMLHSEDYQLLIDLLSFYKDHTFNPVTLSDCPSCTNTVSKNCPTLPKILELI